MNRLTLYLIVFFSLAIIGNALPGPITMDQAQRVALNFFYERVQSNTPVEFSELQVENVYRVSQDGMDLYYVFNFSGGGFIAISANDHVFPVLCYSFDGEYSEDIQPDNFRAWMQQYRRQIFFATETNAPPRDGVTQAWDHYLNAERTSLHPFSGREVLPMLTSHWDQGKYYNEMCPADQGGPGGHCLTGCVATAMGQLLNYFRWPDTGTGSYSYYCPPYDTLSADFGGSTYRYDLMEPSLGHSNLELAKLLYHLGVSVDMVYGPDGSGMYNHKAAYSLKTYFKYSPETQYVFRDSTTMDWDSLLIAHLDQKIPMYYAGWSVPNINGHAFICDGYQGTNFYHFNWGWSGSYDGYFYTDDLTPGGSYFNLAQELIIHAVPDTNLYNYPAGCEGDIIYNEMFGTLEDGSGPMYPYANGSDCSWLIQPLDSVNGIDLEVINFNLSEGDTLKVFDGDSNNTPLLGAFTGDTVPDPVSSTGSTLFVTFQSDDSISQEGFLAYFKSQIPVYCSGSTVLNAQADTLTDGSGSYNYHNNSACTWMISPPGASKVTLYFDEFATEEGFDLLKIYDLGTSQLIAELSGTYPGGVPDPVTSPSGKMFLAFSTNYTNTDAGWTAYYETDLVGIGEMQPQDEFLVYPNPAHDLVKIRLGANYGGYTIILSDLSGKTLVRKENLPGIAEMDLDISNISPGMYFVTLEDGNTKVTCRKVIIR